MSWCDTCNGLGGWDEDGADRGDFGDTEYVECPDCNGGGDDDDPLPDDEEAT